MNKKEPRAVLLDTQAFIFALNSPETIPLKARKLFNRPDTEFYLSLASIWEMSIKISLRKLKLGNALKEVIQTSVKESGLKILEIQATHIYLIEELPFHHKDPFDRLIIAQSLIEKMPVISSDEIFDRYKTERIWK
jgi:PIN domain nuclease of toxin-antitoxin system